MESKRRRRTRLWLAILASLFVHVLVAFALVAFSTATAPPPPLDDDKPIELTVMDLSSAAATPAPPADPQYIETDPSKASAEEPKEKTFISDANSIAASNVDPTGNAALPSQKGEERPFINMDTRQLSLPSEGDQPQPLTESAPPPVPATPAPVETPKPQRIQAPKPTPLPEPLATPPVDQLAMLTGTPPPPIRDPAETEPNPTPQVAPTAPLVEPRPLPQRPGSAYQPQKEETKISGRITNRGATAADAVATPFGRYQKKVQEAIGARWYYYVLAKSDLASIGTARVSAEVDASGHVNNLKIVSNSANEAFANICLQSFQEAQIPPIPPDLVAALPGGRMSLEFSFTYY